MKLYSRETTLTLYPFIFLKIHENIVKDNLQNTTTKSFWKDYEKLPKEIQKAADKTFEIFNNDPTSQSLHFEDMPELGKNVWSARVNDKYRALGIKNGDTIEWYAITNHYR